ncbi:MAG TPA: TerC family protein [Gemmatales bacterium]|nr:TerC family protein [Gemmatales bacterium]
MTEWLVPLVNLTVMEVVLGVDNIIFIAILVGKLPVEMQARIRLLGLSLAVVLRVGLILSINWLMGLTTAVFLLTQCGVPEDWLRPNQASLAIANQQEAQRLAAALPEKDQTRIETILAAKADQRFRETNEVTWKDLILICGGLFLVGKATYEIHDKLENAEHVHKQPRTGAVGMVIAQIVVIDLVFSLDSVITAVGLVQQVWVMIVAMLLAVGTMIAFAGTISRFVNQHPTVKILALSFLVLIGVLLLAEGFGQKIDKGYVYFAMAFAVAIECINLRLRRLAPVTLHNVPQASPVVGDGA